MIVQAKAWIFSALLATNAMMGVMAMQQSSDQDILVDIVRQSRFDFDGIVRINDDRLRKLSRVDLRVNLPSGLSGFVYLEMNDQSLGPDLEQIFANWPDRLNQLWCEGNQLTRIPSNLPRALENLFMAHNHLTFESLMQCDFQQLLPSVTQLDVSANRIDNFNGVNFFGMRTLNIAENQLRVQDFSETVFPQSLVGLNMAAMGLTREGVSTVNFAALTGVHYLDLSRNNLDLDALSSSSLNQIRELGVLDISQQRRESTMESRTIAGSAIASGLPVSVVNLVMDFEDVMMIIKQGIPMPNGVAFLRVYLPPGMEGQSDEIREEILRYMGAYSSADSWPVVICTPY